MNFNPQQAIEVRDAMEEFGVDYLFLGKSGAILLGYPSTTQDVDIFTPKKKENAERLIHALDRLGFDLDDETRAGLLAGKDFVQIKTGPFDLDVIHAPDGIESYEAAKKRSIVTPENFPVANLKDIIASKRAAGRARDKVELHLLESFEQEYLRRFPRPLKSAGEAAPAPPAARANSARGKTGVPPGVE